MSSSIQIYAGDGSSELCYKAWETVINNNVDTRNYKIEHFTHSETFGFDRGKVAMIIFGGGNAHEMVRIKQIDNKVNKAVNEGASILCSCAGAIITALEWRDWNSGRDWKNGSKGIEGLLSNIHPFPINLKYYMPEGNNVTKLRNRTSLKVEWYPSRGHFDTAQLDIFYAFGHSIPIDAIPSTARDSTRIMARYVTEGNIYSAKNSAAVVHYQPLEKGPRIITAIHPEITKSDIRSELFAKAFSPSEKPYIESLAKVIERDEKVHQLMCRSWFSELNIKLNDQNFVL